MWVDGDVNGKDWSRRRGGLFKIVLDTELLNVAPLFHCRAQGCSQLARLETVSSKVSCLFLKDLPQMWTPDNWTAKRRAVICVIFFFSWKIKLYGYRSCNREVLNSLFQTKGLSRLVAARLSSTTPLIPSREVCWGVQSPKKPFSPQPPPWPDATQILAVKSAGVCCLLLCLLLSPRALAVCFPQSCKRPCRGRSSNPSGWWVWSWRALGAFAPCGEFWSVLLQLIKEMGQVLVCGSGVVFARGSIVCYDNRCRLVRWI